MTLPASGTISLSQVSVELLKSSTATTGLGDADVRDLAGVPTGAISMSNLYGKTYEFLFTISSNTNNVNLRTAALAAGWDGIRPVVATIGTGVAISSTSTGDYALTINGAWANGVKLINNGIIVGKGGAGGSGGGDAGGYRNPGVGNPGAAGGPALTVSSSVSFDNTNGIIGGGGGGGGGGGAGLAVNRGDTSQHVSLATGGGGGGGIGFGVGGICPAGSYIETSGNPSGTPTQGSSGGTGTASAAGSGGVGTISNGFASVTGGSGGAAGSYGAAGSSGATATAPGGQDTRILRAGGAGGAAGAAIVGNSNITWLAFGQRYGAIS
jgi:hypothetical protein